MFSPTQLEEMRQDALDGLKRGDLDAADRFLAERIRVQAAQWRSAAELARRLAASIEVEPAKREMYRQRAAHFERLADIADPSNK